MLQTGRKTALLYWLHHVSDEIGWRRDRLCPFRIDRVTDESASPPVYLTERKPAHMQMEGKRKDVRISPEQEWSQTLAGSSRGGQKTKGQRGLLGLSN